MSDLVAQTCDNYSEYFCGAEIRGLRRYMNTTNKIISVDQTPQAEFWFFFSNGEKKESLQVL